MAAKRTHSVLAPRYHQKAKPPKYNVAVSVLEEPRLFKRFFPEMSKAEHERLAHEYADKAKSVTHRWRAAIVTAEKRYGEHGALISGGFHEHWPESVKDRIRKLSRERQELFDAAEAHWKASGKRSVPPWRGQR